MTPPRRRMLEHMQLRCFAARTGDAYLHADSQLANTATDRAPRAAGLRDTVRGLISNGGLQ